MEPTDYPQSWYPVGRSNQLRCGRHRILRAFGHPWLLFRSQSGKVGMTTQHCCHMGTDLGQGRVIGEAIECPLHGWRYSTNGECVFVPSLQGPPQNARQTRLICQERYGLIFAFWGEKPAFDIPLPNGMPTDLSCSSVYSLAIATPHHTPCLNSFDVQHFERIHNRRFVEPPTITRLNSFQLRIDYKALILKRRWVDHLMARLSPSHSTVTIDCWGANLLLLKNAETGYGAIVSMLPQTTTETMVYLVALKTRKARMTLKRRLFDRLSVTLAKVMIRSFLKPDVNVITNMRPLRGVLLDTIDDGTKQYWDYWDELPRWAGPNAAPAHQQP